MTAPTEETTIVGLGEMHAAAATGVLVCLGLGSCIALSAYDPVKKVGGMAHIVLPDGTGRAGSPSPKYADTAVPILLDEMTRLGALRSRLVVRIAGGATMAGSGVLGAVFKIGESNTDATKKALTLAGIRRIAGIDVGGTHGRTVRLSLDTGKLTVHGANRETIEI